MEPRTLSVGHSTRPVPHKAPCAQPSPSAPRHHRSLLGDRGPLYRGMASSVRRGGAPSERA
eukprot:6201704-Pleurochrysis_carterae.AAC.3